MIHQFPLMVYSGPDYIFIRRSFSNSHALYIAVIFKTADAFAAFRYFYFFYDGTFPSSPLTQVQNVRSLTFRLPISVMTITVVFGACVEAWFLH
jgi:hypothetical protein